MFRVIHMMNTTPQKPIERPADAKNKKSDSGFIPDELTIMAPP